MKLRVLTAEEAERRAPIAADAGLEALDERPLGAAAGALLERALQGSRGEPHWRTRKAVELRDLLALAERSERLEVLDIDARTELRVELRLVVPTATMSATPSDVGRVAFAPEARVVLQYPAEVLRGPLPGYSAIAITAPLRVWHPNVGFDRQQRLCLGHNIPRGMPTRELVLLAYAALSMQAVSLVYGNPAGVMNTAALCYWREHERELPLTRESLLDPLGVVDPGPTDREVSR